MKSKRAFGRYERHSDELLPRALFLRRLRQHALLTAAVILGSLALGVLGYHLTEGFPWLDSLLNASMILGGMGPVDALHTDAGKWFASAYALYSGIVVLVAAGILIAPVAHRILHRMHLQADEETGRPLR
jgi:NhaP-type Na+/H+ or K+/H+ antiporter